MPALRAGEIFGTRSYKDAVPTGLGFSCLAHVLAASRLIQNENPIEPLRSRPGGIIDGDACPVAGDDPTNVEPVSRIESGLVLHLVMFARDAGPSDRELAGASAL